MTEMVWIQTTFLGRKRPRNRRWRAVAMRGDQQVGRIVYSRSRKSVRGEAYAALAEQTQSEEISGEGKPALSRL